ncbi:MAG: energy transducer TonB [Hydrogenophaga sp.]
MHLPSAPPFKPAGLRHAVAGSLLLHVALLAVLLHALPSRRPAPPAPDAVIAATVLPSEPQPRAEPPPGIVPARPSRRPPVAPPPWPVAEPSPGGAFMEAPPAPSAEEWAQAATYTLKNSKRYRHHWSQHLRSLMGTAHEGPEQGAVRFRIEIAPTGALARLDTIWSTSPSVEARARAAVQRMPPLPPTPTGQALVFDKTIVFDPWTADAPPLYRHDCEPDPPQHGNRFVWDGRSPQVVAAQAAAQTLDTVAYAECLRQLPQDSIEAEAASDERQHKQWASPTLGR